MQKPGKVTAIEVMCLVAGIFGLIMGFTIMFSTLFLWIPYLYSYVFGIVGIVIGAKLLGSKGYINGQPPPVLPRPPNVVGILAIINILNCDITSVTLGILILVFLADPEVQAYYSGQWMPPPPAQQTTYVAVPMQQMVYTAQPMTGQPMAGSSPYVIGQPGTPPAPGGSTGQGGQGQGPGQGQGQ